MKQEKHIDRIALSLFASGYVHLPVEKMQEIREHVLRCERCYALLERCVQRIMDDRRREAERSDGHAKHDVIQDILEAAPSLEDEDDKWRKERRKSGPRIPIGLKSEERHCRVALTPGQAPAWREGCCINVTAYDMLIDLARELPVKIGQVIRVELGRFRRPSLLFLNGQVVLAVVTRLNRVKGLRKHITEAGLRFLW